MNAPIPTAPQPAAAPLGVSSAPANQPALAAPAAPPVANGQNVSGVGGVAAPISSAPVVHPLYQSSINMLSQVAQLGTQNQAGQPQPDQDGNLSTAQDIGLGVAKGGVQTASTLDNVLGQTVGRVVNAVTGKGFTPITPGSGQEIKADTTAHNTAQSVGKGAEQLLEFLAVPETGLEEAAAKGATAATSAATGLGAAADTAGTIGKVANLGIKAVGEGAKSVAVGQLHNDTNVAGDFAAGAAAPLIGAGLSKAWEALPSLIQKGTGLTDAIVKQATSDPVAFKAAVKSVAENPQAPYVGLAHDVFTGMMDGKQAAKDTYQQGLEKVIQLTDGKTYNVSPQIAEISGVLKKDYGIPVELARNTDGTLSKTVKLVTDTPNGNPFSPTETKNIEGLMNDMRNANGKSFKGLVNLQKNVDSYFDTDVFGNAKSTPYNSVITKLSDIVDKKVSSVAGEAMPTMDAINEQYAQYKKVFNQFGKTFVDTSSGTPQISTKAESFLSNLLGKNKAALQGNVAKELEEFTGVPVLDRAVQTKAAVDFSKLVGEGKLSTVQKLLEKGGKYVGAGIGVATHGLPGIFEGGAIGEGAGRVLGGIGNPSAGLKAIETTQKIGKIASKVADESPVIGGLAKRFAVK